LEQIVMKYPTGPALLLTLLSLASDAIATTSLANSPVVAVQVCAIKRPELRTTLSTNTDPGHQYAAPTTQTHFLYSGTDPAVIAQSEVWKGRTEAGQLVATTWHVAGALDAVIVNNFLYIPEKKIDDKMWTEWSGPTGIVAAGYAEQRTDGNLDPRNVTPMTEKEASEILVRYRLMRFSQFVANDPRYPKISATWAGENIPACALRGPQKMVVSR
jgi:hypothetical protein